MSETDLEVHAKSDRELLIMLVSKMNNSCKILEKHDKWINGNGIPGAKFQVWVMWAVFIALAVKVF
jgi:hypothetical protein